jgi:radical SAM protein with 4Fe4S-binding SPASM domain
MKDFYRIDSHKMIFHVDRVASWLQGKTVCPIYLEIAPCGSCNHRCIFCAVDYLNYKTSFLDVDILKNMIHRAAACGVKSVMYAGEGEPLLHKNIASIVEVTKKAGIDVSITTNGVFLDKKLCGKILKHLSWIRVSLNAGSEKNYERVHRARPGDFLRVLDNLKNAVSIKKRSKLKTVIGVQLLLIPENVGEVLFLARVLKKIGVDYLTIKPYSQHPLSGSRLHSGFAYQDHAALEKRLRQLEDKNFKIIYRFDTMERLGKTKDYEHCFGLPFWAYVNACGDVYACSAFLGKKEFIYGNIYLSTFDKIIKGARRKAILHKAATRLDVNKCREVCRLDKINSYLRELKDPGPHVNFI